MPHAEGNFGFSLKDKIKSSLQIKELVDARQSVFVYPIKCFYDFVADAADADASLAVVVPKKRFHHAVDRNRLKRLMREAYRVHKYQHAVPDSNRHLRMCWIFVGKELVGYQAVEKAAVQILNKIAQIESTCE